MNLKKIVISKNSLFFIKIINEFLYVLKLIYCSVDVHRLFKLCLNCKMKVKFVKSLICLRWSNTNKIGTCFEIIESNLSVTMQMFLLMFYFLLPLKIQIMITFIAPFAKKLVSTTSQTTSVKPVTVLIVTVLTAWILTILSI